MKIKKLRTGLVSLFICSTAYGGNFFQGLDYTDNVKKAYASSKALEIDDMRFDLKSINSGATKWPDGKLIYEFSTTVNPRQQRAFLDACAEWEYVANVKCVKRNGERDYVYVLNGQGNYSFVGKSGGKQPLSIVNWNEKFIIAHEIMHALGFGHEQSRPDRDDFVEIHFENIKDEFHSNFRKFRGEMNSDYDYESIMHYGSHTFSKNRKQTITALHFDDKKIGQRRFLSELDKKDMIDAYGESDGVTSPYNPYPSQPDDPTSFHVIQNYGKLEFKNIPENTSYFRISFVPEYLEGDILFPETLLFDNDFALDSTWDLRGVEKIIVRTYDSNNFLTSTHDLILYRAQEY